MGMEQPEWVLVRVEGERRVGRLVKDDSGLRVPRPVVEVCWHGHPNRYVSPDGYDLRPASVVDRLADIAMWGKPRA